MNGVIGGGTSGTAWLCAHRGGTPLSANNNRLDEMPAQFRVPEVEDNEEGWGPVSIPDHLSDIPYAPFGKGEKVGKISDFTQAGSKFGGVLSSRTSPSLRSLA